MSMRSALALAVLLAVSGCSLVAPKLETPKLSIVGVEMQKGDMFEQRMKVRMRVQNPNDRVLPIKGLSYTLEVAGTELANGVSAASFRVPAFGEAEFDMNVTANMISIITQLMSRKDGLKQADEVPYRLVGKVQLSEGLLRTIPFEEKGSFKLR